MSSTITTREIARMRGTSIRAAQRLIAVLEAQGLKRKGRGRGTHYLRRDFDRRYEEWDTRP